MLLLFNFALEYAIRKVQVNPDGMQINGTHQLLVYADYAIILGRSVHTKKKNTDAFVVASKETAVEVNAHKSTWSCLEIRMPKEVTV